MKGNNILPAVAVAIFNEEGQILLQNRQDRNQWGLISGHVEFGEKVEEAAVREILEETGLKAKITRLIGVYSEPATQTYTYPSGKQVQYVTTYFHAQFLEPFNPTFFNEETLKLQFFYPNQLPEELLLMNPFWLQDALSEHGVFIR